MPETVRIEDATEMLEVARFHLRGFESEHRKPMGGDYIAMKAFLIACLQAGGSVFYTLSNRDEDLVNPFLENFRSWKTHLMKERKDDYDFFFRMVDYRGAAVHTSTVATTVAHSAIPAHLVPNVQVMGSPFALVPNPTTGGSPAYARAWVMINKLRFDDADATTTCYRFLHLLDELVQYCKATPGDPTTESE